MGCTAPDKGIASVLNSLALMASGVKIVASERRANERIVTVVASTERPFDRRHCSKVKCWRVVYPVPQEFEEGNASVKLADNILHVFRGSQVVGHFIIISGDVLDVSEQISTQKFPRIGGGRI